MPFFALLFMGNVHHNWKSLCLFETAHNLKVLPFEGFSQPQRGNTFSQHGFYLLSCLSVSKCWSVLFPVLSVTVYLLVNLSDVLTCPIRSLSCFFLSTKHGTSRNLNIERANLYQKFFLSEVSFWPHDQFLIILGDRLFLAQHMC